MSFIGLIIPIQLQFIKVLSHSTEYEKIKKNYS